MTSQSDDNGIVYILTNDAMPGYIKIGMTSDLKQRLSNLDNTSIPLPFQCYYAAKVSNPRRIENRLHEAFGDRRTRKNREFFQIDPYRVKCALEMVAIEEIIMDDDTPSDVDSETCTKRPRFKFSMVGISENTILTYAKNSSITCTVLNNSEVQYENKTWSLSGLTSELQFRETGKRIAKQGPAYWLYDGKTLDEIRTINEKN